MNFLVHTENPVAFVFLWDCVGLMNVQSAKFRQHLQIVPIDRVDTDRWTILI
jgi:hypothetical protein